MAKKYQSIEDYVGDCRKEDRSYAESWIPEAIQWSQNGVYAAIADGIGTLPPDSTFLDLGCGLGQVPLLVKRANPNAIVAGTDSNASMISWAVQNMPNDIRVRLHHNELARLNSRNEGSTWHFSHQQMGNYADGKGGVRAEDRLIGYKTLFPLRFETPDLSADPDTVNFIIDDIRHAHLLEEVLGGRTVSAMSMNFPGGSNRFEVERENDRPKTADKRNQKRGDHFSNLFSVWREFLRKNLAVGGTFVSANRVPHLSDDALRTAILGDFSRFLGNDFEIENVAISSNTYPLPRGGLSWVGSAGSIPEAKVAILVAKRTSKT